jgi:Na+/glutamate symporter
VGCYVDLDMAVTDVLLVIGFVAIGLSMWFSFKQKENTKPKEIQSDEEE